MLGFSSEPETPPAQMPLFKKLLLIIILAVIALSAIILLGPLLGNIAPSSQDPNNYDVVTFALYQTIPYSQDGVDYEFSFVPAGPSNILQVTSGGQTTSHSAFAGASYTTLGLNLKIVSANDVIVLNVAPA